MKSARKNPIMIFMFVLFMIYAISILFVIGYGLDISLMSTKDIRNSAFFPSKINVSNYVKAWKELAENDYSLIDMTFNSLWYAGGVAFFNVLFSSMTAYVISKYKFPGRNTLYTYAIVTMMIPILGATAAEIKLYNELNIYDTQFLIFMFTSSFGENFIILFAVFKSLSWEYAEAAFIDGASDFTVWYKIMLPQVISPMVALFVVGFIERWGDTDTALLFMKSHPSLASGLYIYGKRNSYNVPIYFSGFMMCMVPVLILYLCFQNSIMDLQFGGGLKG